MCGEDELIRLPPEILAKLRQRAARLNISVDEYLEEIAREYLDHLEHEEEGEES
jgi:predicted HicB family RNase H-like nuclease